MQNFIHNSRNLLVITGAGCSTASGIGDYRDEQGQWKRVQPVQHQDFVASAHWRQRYWARSQIGYPEFLRAQPNSAHDILCQWERKGKVFGLITQNVDRLHQRAGHRDVIDLHGRLDQVVCLQCNHVSARDQLQAWLERQNQQVATDEFAPAPDGDAELERSDYSSIRVPTCLHCGGMLKPHVVFYGDSVPAERVELAYQWVARADGVLIVGSSLMVFSSYRFVKRAHELGIPIAAINRGVTRADDWLQVKVEQDCGLALGDLSLD